jgi:hypothetical protein
VDETDSIFHYFDNTSYSIYNSDYLTFMPTFTSELMTSLPSDVDSVCQGNQACLYDYAISGNTELGNSTQMAAMSSQDLQAILSKFVCFQCHNHNYEMQIVTMQCIKYLCAIISLNIRLILQLSILFYP